MSRILVIDDDEVVLTLIKTTLDRLNYTVSCHDNPTQALAELDEGDFDVVISDYIMPDMNGVDFLKEVKSRQPDVIRIIVSGQADSAALINAVNEAEIYRFITKPWDQFDFMINIHKAVEHRQVLLKNAKLTEEIAELRQTIDRQHELLKMLEANNPDIIQVQLERDDDAGKEQAP